MYHCSRPFTYALPCIVIPRDPTQQVDAYSETVPDNRITGTTLDAQAAAYGSKVRHFRSVIEYQSEMEGGVPTISRVTVVYGFTLSYRAIECRE